MSNFETRKIRIGKDEFIIGAPAPMSESREAAIAAFRAAEAALYADPEDGNLQAAYNVALARAQEFCALEGR